MARGTEIRNRKHPLRKRVLTVYKEGVTRKVLLRQKSRRQFREAKEKGLQERRNFMKGAKTLFRRAKEEA